MAAISTRWKRWGRPSTSAGLVGHCAVRFYVMGERAVEEPATDDEVRQIAELAGQSVREGAVGFSTNRLPGHRLPDGRSIPGTFAHRDELRAVAKEVGAAGGIMQTVSDFRDFDAELDLIRDEARTARGALFSTAAEIGVERMDERVKAMRAEGLNVTSVTVPRSGGGVGGLSTNNFFRTDGWNELRKLDLDGRLKAIRDPETRRRLVDEVKAQGDEAAEGMKRWFYMGDQARPCYTQSPGTRASTIRRRRSASIRWKRGSASATRRTARRCSICAASTSISRLSKG